MFTEGGFGKRVTRAQFGDMYGVVHKALMAYPVFIGREADIVVYGIRTMDEGKDYPDPSSTAEPLRAAQDADPARSARGPLAAGVRASERAARAASTPSGRTRVVAALPRKA